MYCNSTSDRSVAQPGSASGLGAEVLIAPSDSNYSYLSTYLKHINIDSMQQEK